MTYYCVQLVLTTTLFITYIWQILVQSKKFCDNEALANLFKISCKWIKVLKNGLQCLFIENIHFPSEKSCNYRSISNSTKNFYSILVDTANHLSQSIKINKSLFFSFVISWKFYQLIYCILLKVININRYVFAVSNGAKHSWISFQ